MAFWPKLVLVSILTCGAMASYGQVPQLPTTEKTLANGLKVIVREDHRAPVANVQVWYKVGATYEPDGITGISHMTEHLMFKGTPKYPANTFSKLIAENGGTQNAFTSYDYTAYHEEIAAKYLPLVFDLEADRMSNLNYTKEAFASEHLVVTEERRLRIEDQPINHAFELFSSTAFTANPYHRPIIGWMEDIKNYSYEDAMNWYRTWYKPNNAVLVVVGDVQPQQIFELAQKYFGPIPAGAVPKTKPVPQIEPLGTKTVEMKLPSGVPIAMFGYPVPTISTAEKAWEPYALSMAAAILSTGDSSRIPKDLVRARRIAAEASASYDLSDRLPTMFTVYGVPAGQVPVETLMTEMQKSVQNLATSKIEPQELERIYNQIRAALFFSEDSLFYQAKQIGELESINLPWKLQEQYLDEMKKVTPEQIKTVVAKYLTPDRMTTGIVRPTTTKGA